MIIRIDGKLFTIPPDERFAIIHNLNRGFWNELWRRFSMLEYTPTELKEYFELKTGKKTNSNTMQRWILRTQIYYKVQPFVKKGVSTVSTEIFGDLENDLIKELTRQYKSGVITNHRIII